jgi:hypothetical protein
MSCADQSLGRNEAILYRGRFPMIRHAGGWIFLIIAVIGLIALAGGHGLLATLLVVVGVSLFVANMIPDHGTRRNRPSD